VDATMKRTRVSSIVAVVLSLLMIPAVWIFAFDALPPLSVIRTESSGGRMGPWVFSWALVWIATISCFAVAWLCYSSLDDATS
jgi:hypothetical protein